MGKLVPVPIEDGGHRNRGRGGPNGTKRPGFLSQCAANRSSMGNDEREWDAGRVSPGPGRAKRVRRKRDTCTRRSFSPGGATGAAFGDMGAREFLICTGKDEHPAPRRSSSMPRRRDVHHMSRGITGRSAADGRLEHHIRGPERRGDRERRGAAPALIRRTNASRAGAGSFWREPGAQQRIPARRWAVSRAERDESGPETRSR